MCRIIKDNAFVRFCVILVQQINLSSTNYVTCNMDTLYLDFCVPVLMLYLYNTCCMSFVNIVSNKFIFVLLLSLNRMPMGTLVCSKEFYLMCRRRKKLPPSCSERLPRLMKYERTTVQILILLLTQYVEFLC